MAGVTPVAALDMWELAAETYALNFPEATVYRMKASSLSPHRVAQDVGRIDLLLASLECTNHSVAKVNKPRCEKSRNTAFEVIRFAKVLQPRWIVVENVLQMQRWCRGLAHFAESSEQNVPVPLSACLSANAFCKLSFCVE